MWRLILFTWSAFLTICTYKCACIMFSTISIFDLLTKYTSSYISYLTAYHMQFKIIFFFNISPSVTVWGRSFICKCTLCCLLGQLVKTVSCWIIISQSDYACKENSLYRPAAFTMFIRLSLKDMKRMCRGWHNTWCCGTHHQCFFWQSMVQVFLFGHFRFWIMGVNKSLLEKSYREAEAVNQPKESHEY